MIKTTSVSFLVSRLCVVFLGRVTVPGPVAGHVVTVKVECVPSLTFHQLGSLFDCCILVLCFLFSEEFLDSSFPIVQKITFHSIFIVCTVRPFPRCLLSGLPFCPLVTLGHPFLALLDSCQVSLLPHRPHPAGPSSGRSHRPTLQGLVRPQGPHTRP